MADCEAVQAVEPPQLPFPGQSAAEEPCSAQPCRDFSQLPWAPPIPPLLDCWEAREALGTFPSVSYVVAEPRTWFCVKTWNPLCAVLPLCLSCWSPYCWHSIFLSLRKQKTTVTQACFSCSVSFFFFPPKGFNVSGLCNTALWCCAWVSKKISQHQWCHINLVLAAALIFCFLHLIAIMPCNEKAECLSPECLRQSQCFLCLNISKWFLQWIYQQTHDLFKMFQRILVFYSWTLLKIVWRVVWITAIDAFHIFLKFIDHIKNLLSRGQRGRMKNLNVKYWKNFLTPIKNLHCYPYRIWWENNFFLWVKIQLV